MHQSWCTGVVMMVVRSAVQRSRWKNRTDDEGSSVRWSLDFWECVSNWWTPPA